jgi:hypothetical protein
VPPVVKKNGLKSCGVPGKFRLFTVANVRSNTFIHLNHSAEVIANFDFERTKVLESEMTGQLGILKSGTPNSRRIGSAR